MINESQFNDETWLTLYQKDLQTSLKPIVWWTSNFSECIPKQGLFSLCDDFRGNIVPEVQRLRVCYHGDNMESSSDPLIWEQALGTQGHTLLYEIVDPLCNVMSREGL